MRTDESKPLSEKRAVPAKGAGLKRPAPPEPPKPPSAQKPAADGKDATSADAAAQAMPDLDQFNFMKW